MGAGRVARGAARPPFAAETLHGREYKLGLGGKGANQAVAARKLGSDVRFVCRLGADDFAEPARRELASYGVDLALVRQDSSGATGIAIINVGEGGENYISLIGGSNLTMDDSDVERARPALAGARVLLLDGSDAVAAVSADEIGSELTWRAAGADDGTVLAFEDRGGLPWPVAHLQAADGTLSWTRRGADLPESWALPEGDNTGRFAVSFDMGSGFGDAAGVAEAAATIPSGAVAARVAEIGADGRIGPWVSIGLGTP